MWAVVWRFKSIRLNSDSWVVLDLPSWKTRSSFQLQLNTQMPARPKTFSGFERWNEEAPLFFSCWILPVTKYCNYMILHVITCNYKILHVINIYLINSTYQYSTDLCTLSGKVFCDKKVPSFHREGLLCCCSPRYWLRKLSIAIALAGGSKVQVYMKQEIYRKETLLET